MKKILVFIFILFVSTFGGLIIYINQNIDDTKINELVINLIEENLVGVKASIEEIDYKLGLSVDINISNLSVKDLKTDKDIFTLKETKLEVNIFSILTGGGKIDILIDSPVINILKNKNGDLSLNKYLAKDKENNNKEASDSKDSNVSFEVPSFVENSKLNFKLTGLLVNYTDGKLSQFRVDKILLKNLNLKTPTAYELDSFIDYSINEKDSISFTVKLFGELALEQLISSKELNVTSYIYIQKIKTNLVKKKISDIESEVKISLNQVADLNILFITKVKDLLESNLSVVTKDKSMKITLEKISLDLKEAFSLVGIDSLKVADSKLVLSGDVETDLAFSKLVPDLSVSMSKAMSIEIEKTEFVLSKLNLLLENKQLDFNLNASIFDGNVDIKANTTLDLLKPPSSIESLSRINSKIRVKDIVIPSEYYEFKEDSQAKVDANPKDEGTKVETSILLPSTETSIVVSNIGLGTSKLSVNSSISSGGYEISSRQTGIQLDDSKTNLSFKVNLKKGVSSKFKLTSSELDFRSFKSFVPQKYGELSGVLSLDVDGATNNDEYDVSGYLIAKDGSLKGLKLKEMISEFLGKLSKFLPKKEIKITENYDLLSSSFNASSDKVTLKKLNLVGKNESLNLNLKGDIQQSSKESQLIGSLSVQEYDRDVKKISGTNNIPLLLKGPGYSLKPSLSYTTKNLVKNKANNEVKKLKNSIKEKAKDLFKGFKL